MAVRQAWTHAIEAADYEAHMAGIGQAEANAGLVAQLLTLSPPPEGAAILFAGAGTGQMFDYLDAGLLRPFRTTFTDINPAYLARLRGRLEGRGLTFETHVDDVERPGLAAGFDLAIVVLVLEHVEWRLAVGSLCRLARARVFVVIQEDPPGFAEARPAVGTMQILRDLPAGRIDRPELAGEFAKHNFGLLDVYAREVADGKKMVGMEFVRDRPAVLTPPR